MSGLSENKGRSVSLADRLRSTDKFLTEMRSVLASMDEIDGLRRQRGEAVTDEFGGYKRSSVTKLVEGLEKQRDSILAEIAKEEQRNAELVRRAQEEAAARRRAEAQNAELARRAETEAEARRRAEEESAKAQEARLVAVEKSVRESEERRLAQAQQRTGVVDAEARVDLQGDLFDPLGGGKGHGLLPVGDQHLLPLVL